MVDKIKKALIKMTAKEREAYLLISEILKIDYKQVPNILKLKNSNNLYRIRMGRFRIIIKVENKEVKIIRLTKRDNNTYKKL